jgi:hypothetical protein
MLEKPEEIMHKYQELEGSKQDIHKNFRPGEKVVSERAAESGKDKATNLVEKQRSAAMGAKFQGDIGEGITLRAATEKLGLTPDPRFDQARHGYDAVCRDEKGKLAVVESKFDERGIKALKENQMQPDWVEKNAKMMQNPGNERFTTGNAEIGRDIQRKGADNIRRIVVTTDPRTLEIQAYEGQKDGNWKLIMEPWSALDLEQPYLK